MIYLESVIYKDLYGAEVEIERFNDKDMSFIAWASKGTLDRDNELIDPSGWDLDNYNRNPIVPCFHDYNKFPVAKSLWTKTYPDINPEGLKFKPKFANTPIGKETYYLYREGFMNAFSVGFKPKESVEGKDAKAPKRKFTKQELLEISCVLVPCNPDALVEALHSGIVKTKELTEWFNKLIIETKQVESENENYDSYTIKTVELESRITLLEQEIKTLKEANTIDASEFEDDTIDIELDDQDTIEIDLDDQDTIEIEETLVEVGD